MYQLRLQRYDSGAKYLQKHIDTYVSGGKYGVSLLGSKMDGDDVALKAYKVKLPVSFFAVDGIWIEDYSNSRKWTAKIPAKKLT